MTASKRVGANRAASLITVIIALAVVVAVVLGTFAVVGKGGASGAQAFTSADIVTAEFMDFDVTTTATGDLAAKSQVEIRSQLDDETTILEVIEEGVTVKKGELLVQLNSERIETEIEEEELRVDAAQAAVIAADNAYLIQESRNASALRDAELSVELKELALEQWLKGDDERELQRIRLRIASAERELERLQLVEEKDIQLNAQNFLSDNELAKSMLAVIKAEAEHETAILEEEIYNNYIKPREKKTKESDVVQAEAKLVEVRAQNTIELANKESNRGYERSQLQRREARMARYRADFAATEIRAPTDGLVVYGTSVQRDRWGNNNEGPLQIGRRVHPNMLLVILPDTNEMIAQVRVHESLVGQISRGQVAEIKIDAAEGQVFKGKVTDIGVLAEGGGWRDPNRREYSVKITLDVNGEEAGLKPSMRCEATIVMDHVVNGLAIPLPALFSESGVRYVYLREGGKFIKRPVKIGRRSDTYVEILGGLTQGDRVLAREPSSIEVVQRDWDQNELKVAGYELDENGAIIPPVRTAATMPEQPQKREGGEGRGRPQRSGGKAETGQGMRPGRQGGAGQGERPKKSDDAQ